MFGNVSKRKIFISLVLFLFCVYIIRLFIRDEINLYIHPRYTIFAVVMATLGAIVILFGNTGKDKKQHTHQKKQRAARLIDGTVVVVLLFAIILPAQPLSSNAIGRKSLNTPTNDVVDSVKPCPETRLNPDQVSIDVWVYEISEYPPRCFEGEAIALTGFVFESVDDPLPDNMYYLGRVIMSCCVIDARPYALPIMKDGFENYPKETWLTVKGKLKITKVNGTEQLVIHPSSVQKVDRPDQPYQYINTEQPQVAQPIEAIQ